MEQTLIKTIELSNGLKLDFYDISRKLAGDRWYVGVIARIDIPLIDSLLTNQHLSHYSVEEIRNALGESVRFQQKRGATMTNHAKVAEIFPEAYQGIIQMSDKEMTIIEAATFRGLPALLKRYGEWVITKNGIDSLAANYHIAKDRLDEYDWIKHMSEKTWVNIHDFERAFFMAQTMLELEII